MYRTLLPATVILGLFACSSHWYESTKLDPLTIDLGTDIVEVGIDVALTREKAMNCEELEAYLEVSWSGEDVAFTQVDGDGETLETNVESLGGDAPVRLWGQPFASEDDGSCSAHFSLRLEPNDTAQTAELAITVHAEDSSSAPDDDATGAVLVATGAVL